MKVRDLIRRQKKALRISVLAFVIACASLVLGVFCGSRAEAQELGAATLSWTAPTQNEDATPLTDLAGYKIYYGDAAGGPYNTAITVPNPSTTTYIVDNLAPGDYHFVTTAYNTKGTESRFSNEAMKTIGGTTPPPPPPGPLAVSVPTVFTVVKQTDAFVLIPVGTIPVGTLCDESQAVNNHNVVPSDQMTPFGTVVPLVVVAKCER